MVIKLNVLFVLIVLSFQLSFALPVFVLAVTGELQHMDQVNPNNNEDFFFLGKPNDCYLVSPSLNKNKIQRLTLLPGFEQTIAVHLPKKLTVDHYKFPLPHLHFLFLNYKISFSQHTAHD